MTARYPEGTLVRILDLGKEGHVRIPSYVREKVGVVERWCGAYPNPEELAYGRPGLPVIDLFRVRLRQVDLWPEYPGCPSDTLDIEVYEHWLSPVEGK